MKQASLILLVLVSTAWTTMAQTPIDHERAFREVWRWVEFGRDSGLPHPRVLEITETAEGVPWVVTARGLAWFDGYRWQAAGSPTKIKETGLRRLWPGFRGGIVFRVFLPASDAAATAPQRDAATPEHWHTEGTILVVDDEEAVRSLAQGTLKQCGLEVINASDGRAGVRAFIDHQDELRGVLLDLTMPVLDGHEASREIRRRDPAVPIILSSGNTAQEAQRTIHESERIYFLQKPYSPSKLIAVIQKALTEH